MTALEKFVFVDERDGDIISFDLNQLTLAYEELTHLPQSLVDEYATFIQILDLSQNKLTKVDFLSKFENLSTLILDHNFISSDVIFPYIPTVTTLWLNHNLVDQLHPFIKNVSNSFPNLRYLSLMLNLAAPSYLNGGTYTEYAEYRFGALIRIYSRNLHTDTLFVISWIQNLQYLDDGAVTDRERKQAYQRYGQRFYKFSKYSKSIPIFHYLQYFQDKIEGLGDFFGIVTKPNDNHWDIVQDKMQDKKRPPRNYIV